MSHIKETRKYKKQNFIIFNNLLIFFLSIYCRAPMTTLQKSEKLKNQKNQKNIKSFNGENKNDQLWKFLEISNYKRKYSLEPHVVSSTQSEIIESPCSVQYLK
ncbi:hypothetical protein DMUE_3213 [Dictyocoela muelleri]|nr:hypothetical protein DMUE_3213 [Dictyocoela muelleri]